jgi:Lrp/AsnC family transcriptional regulator
MTQFVLGFKVAGQLLVWAKVAERAGLFSSPCWGRIQKRIEDGIILRRVALLDPNKVNAGVNVFVSIRTNQHSLELG